MTAPFHSALLRSGGPLSILQRCAFSTAILILLCGDVEANPGPTRSPQESFVRTVVVPPIKLLLILAVLQATESITLEQTVPDRNELICPGVKVVYVCTSNTGNLQWEIPSVAMVFAFTQLSKVNVPVMISSEFNVTLLEINGSRLVSTATSSAINSSFVRIECRDGFVTLAQDIGVAEQPDSCLGEVTCSATALPDNSQSPIVNVSFTALSTIRCAVAYEFMLGSERIMTKETTATFTNVTFGMPYKDQAIYTLDAKGRKGAMPCYFSITGPNAIEEVSNGQNCIGSTIELSFIFEEPSFPQESCLDPDQVVLEYIVTLTGSVVANLVTRENSFRVNATELGDFQLTITPTLPDLGLSGGPLQTTLAVTPLCEATGSDSSSAAVIASIVLAVLMGVMMLVLAAMICFLFHVGFVLKKKTVSQVKAADVEGHESTHSLSEPAKTWPMVKEDSVCIKDHDTLEMEVCDSIEEDMMRMEPQENEKEVEKGREEFRERERKETHVYEEVIHVHADVKETRKEPEEKARKEVEEKVEKARKELEEKAREEVEKLKKEIKDLRKKLIQSLQGIETTEDEIKKGHAGNGSAGILVPGHESRFPLQSSPKIRNTPFSPSNNGESIRYYAASLHSLPAAEPQTSFV